MADTLTPVELDDLNDRARRLARRISDALWNLDSARSLLRKAESGVYRSSETTGDTGWNPETYRLRVAACALIVSKLLAELGQ